jgi:hypothetical protein
MQLCRNKKHPITERTRKSNGGTECSGCRRDEREHRNATRPVDRDGSVDPSIFEASRRWRASWAATIDATIARIRAEEGFDGRRQRWQTLGEYLRLDAALREQIAAPAPAPLPQRRIIGRCRGCGAPRREDIPCDFCATVLGKVAS